jgi:flagellar L-ring protein precursor FlgH
MRFAAIALGLLLVASSAGAQTGAPAGRNVPGGVENAKLKTQDGKGKAQPRDNYDQLLQEYLASARATAAAAATAAPAGGDSSWMSGLFGDLRARRVNDLVTIQVVESATAVGSADAALAKDSSASASVTSLFGLESKYPGFLDPSALASLGANTDFKGSGSTTRSGSLSAVITGRVAEVLPNGDLAVEGIRELDINGDRQIIVLTGIVRTADIGPGNVVPSTAIGQMRIRYFGRGLIKDNLSPGWLVRIINKIF